MRSFLFVRLTVLAVLCQRIYAIVDCEVNTAPMFQLKQHLLCGYDADVRPTQDHRNPTNVTVFISIEHYSVYETTNAVNLHTFTKLMWKDPFFTWTPSKYAGIEKIHVVSNEIWMPDVTLHSASDAGVDINMPKTDCVIFTGTVMCVPQVVYTMNCEKDTTWWPYDVITCALQVSSWAYSVEDVNTTFTNIEYSKKEIISDKEWGLINITMNERVVDSKFGSDFRSKLITYNILLQRQSSINGVNYVTIAIVLFAVTLIILWLEPNSDERMLLASLNFIMHLLALTHMAWTVPSNGHSVPKLVLLYEDSFLLAMFALMLTSVLRHMHGLTIDAPSWVSSASTFILKSRVGQVFLVTVSDPKVAAQMEASTEDNTNLVSSEKKQSTWRCTSILIRWLSFVIVLFTCTILLAVRLPTSKSAYPIV